MRVRGGGSPLSTVAAEDKEKEGRGTNSNPVGWVKSVSTRGVYAGLLCRKIGRLCILLVKVWEQEATQVRQLLCLEQGTGTGEKKYVRGDDVGCTGRCHRAFTRPYKGSRSFRMGLAWARQPYEHESLNGEPNNGGAKLESHCIVVVVSAGLVR